MKKTFELSKYADRVKPLGRYQMIDKGIACDHCATGIELSANISGEVELTLITTVEKEYCDSAYFTVYIDGVRADKRLEAPSGEQTVVVADSLTSGIHTLRIVKQTESNYTLCNFHILSF